MTARTPTPTDVDPVVALEEALAAQRDVERRLVDGEPVTTADFAEADHRVGLAEARAAAAAVRRAEEAEAAKQAIIRPVLASLTDGHLDAQARRLLELHDQAAAAVGALHAAAVEYVEGLRGAADQLFRADRTSAMRPPNAPRGELVVDRAGGVLRLGDGRRFWFRGEIPAELVAEAAGTAVPPAVLAKVAATQLVQKKTRIGKLRDATLATAGEMTDG